MKGKALAIAKLALILGSLVGPFAVCDVQVWYLDS